MATKTRKNAAARKGGLVKRTLLLLLGLSLLALIAVGLQINRLLDKVQYADGDSGAGSLVPDELSGDGLESDSPPSEIDALEKHIIENIKSQSNGVVCDRDVFNVLLIGCDARTRTGPGRSDSMIILSVNSKTRALVMTSLMRDIYLQIPGHANNRLNASHAFGGPKLLLRTIKENFQIDIDKYISVNFFSFIDIIDELGGVVVDLSDAECNSMNGYIHEINHLEGYPVEDGKLYSGGEGIWLNGKQALAYSRVRYVGRADFQRTERQRIVMEQVAKKLSQMSVTKLYGILEKLLPMVTTNLTKGELFSLLLSAPAYKNFALTENRIPVDGSYKYMTIRKMSVLGIDFQKNIKALRSGIYG